MALGATFDPVLVEAAGDAISDEGRAKHLHHLNTTTGASAVFYGLDFFAPNINIVKDIRWGRAQETYGEDPTLTGTLGSAVIRGMQQYNFTTKRFKVIATAKHFASYNLESNFAMGGTNGQYRLMYNANVTHADLLQTFFPAFEDVIAHGPVGSIMCSYNRLNGIPMCASPYLQNILRDHLNFPGYLVSDDGAIDFMVTKHKWASNHTVAAAAALRSGVDLNLGGVYAKSLPQALSLGMIKEEMIDASLFRVLQARLQLGMFQDDAARASNPWEHVPMSVVDSKEHRKLARTLATESIVLLKNDHQFLPLRDKTTLTGTSTSSCSWNNSTNRCEGTCAGGSTCLPASCPPPQFPCCSCPAPSAATTGSNTFTASSVTLTSSTTSTTSTTSTSSISSTSSSSTSAKQRVLVVGPNADRVATLLSNYPGCKTGPGSAVVGACTLITPLAGLRAGSKEGVREITFMEGVHVDDNDTTNFTQVFNAANQSDVVIFIGGYITCQEDGDQCIEAEARDRASNNNPHNTPMDFGTGLPKEQMALLNMLSKGDIKTTTPIVLVIMSGSGVSVPTLQQSPNVRAIIQLFYPGEEGGNALADVIYGKISPSGRLPVTVPTDESQVRHL